MMNYDDEEDFFPNIDPHKDLPRLLSSAALLQEPFEDNSRYSDNIVITGKVSTQYDKFFIDVDDRAPAAVSQRLKSSIHRQFGINALSIKDVEKGMYSGHSLISGGTLLGVHKEGKRKSEAIRYALLKRGTYLKNDPEQGYLSTPEALNHPRGGCAEKLSVTMLKEAQEEIQIFLMGRTKGRNSEKSSILSIFEKSSDFGVYPVMMLHKGRAGLPDETYKNILHNFRTQALFKNSVNHKYDLPLDHNKEIDSVILPHMMRDPLKLNVHLDESWSDRMKIVVTRIKGKVFDRAEGVPFVDAAYNTLELTQPLMMEVPKQKKIIHLLGCEPDFDNQALFLSERELLNISVAAKYPFIEGVPPGGLARASFAFFRGHSSDLSFDNTATANSPLYELARHCISKEIEHNTIREFEI